MADERLVAVTFTATSVGIEENEEDDFLDVWLGEAPGGAGGFVSFQRSLHAIDQDEVDMGMDSYCVAGSNGATVYGALREVRLAGNVLELTFAAEDAQILGLEEHIRIRLDVGGAELDRFAAGLRSVLRWGRPHSIPALVGL